MFNYNKKEVKTMKELLKKLKENNRLDALESEETLQKAAAELGYTKEQIDTMLSELDGFPINDDMLDKITGGWGEIFPPFN